MHKYINELIGTFFLVLTIGCTVLAGASGVIPALAIGSILMVMIYAGGHLSGAHYNPAVTLAVWLRNRLAMEDVLPYMAAQIIGAALASFVVLFLKGHPFVMPMHPVVGPALLAEFLFTFALAYVVLNVATSRATAGNSFYGLAIGFTVLAGAFAVGSISGGAFNPAVAIGVAFLGLVSWQSLWIYFVACFLGAAAAAFTFNYLNPEDK